MSLKFKVYCIFAVAFNFFALKPTPEVCFDISSDDMEWKPPSDAELKVIQARRERQDKISKIMGEYLLKGYKMLGTVCSKCEVSPTAGFLSEH